eukprot:COSAG02_NODE_42579_length_383_cov_0.806338_2_plen_72_part_01
MSTSLVEAKWHFPANRLSLVSLFLSSADSFVNVNERLPPARKPYYNSKPYWYRTIGRLMCSSPLTGVVDVLR